MSARYWLTRWLLITALCSASSAAAAQAATETTAESSPPRYVATWSLGAPLRLAADSDYGQDALAPFFTDALFGYVFPSSRRFRHGVGLGASLNLSADGGFAEPVYAAEQLAIMPAYLLYLDMGHDWFGMGHLGVPVVVTQTTTAGVEVGAALGYRVLAGAGVFAELALDTFVGAGSALHPALAFELGFLIDFEVLP